MRYVDQERPRALAAAVKRTVEQDVVGRGRSLLLHVEGRCQNRCRTPLKTAASFLIDAAFESGVSVRPLRFAGGLPVDGPPSADYDFPYRMAAQDMYVGASLDPALYRSLPRPERRRYVLDTIMSLGPDWHGDEPNPPNAAFQLEVMEWMNQSGSTLVDAVAFCALRRVPETEWSWPTALMMDVVRDGVKPRLADVMRPELVPWVSRYFDRYLGTVGMWAPEREPVVVPATR